MFVFSGAVARRPGDEDDFFGLGAERGQGHKRKNGDESGEELCS
jgi:hypothetical protein